jgi:hypothetical protein
MDCGKQKADAEYYLQPDDPIRPTGLVVTGKHFKPSTHMAQDKPGN